MQKNYNENLVAGAAIRDDKGRRISKLFEASHPKMTVGYAKNLIMPDTPTEQEFNFRQAGGGVIEDGVAVIDKVKGKSIVWNQLVRAKGNDYTMEFTSDYQYYEFQNQPGVVGHKYCVGAEMKSSNGATVWFGITPSNYNYGVTCGTTSTSFVSVASIGVCQEYNSQIPTIKVFGMNGGGITIKDNSAFVIDLTQMFGAGNEPSTYAEFLQRKPFVEDEYAYNEGTIVNNKVEAIKTSGVNLWNEQWEQGSLNAQGEPVTTTASIRSKEFGRCLPNCEICYSCQSGASKLIYWYDVNKAFISRDEIASSESIYGVTTSPANAYFFKVRNDKSTYNHDICINLSDPAINGQYFPYEEHTLDLSWVKEIKDAEGVKLFEDGMKSTGTAFDEVVKNKAVKRIGVIDMGEMTWSKRDDISPSMFASNGIAPNNKIGLCPIASINKNLYDATLVDGALYWMGNYVMMYNSKFTTIDDFVNFVSGTPIYYELAEPIEVEYDEKSLTYPVVAGGTEEAIASESSTAFRADIGYGIDAVKTILDLKARVEALEGK